MLNPPQFEVWHRRIALSDCRQPGGFDAREEKQFRAVDRRMSGAHNLHCDIAIDLLEASLSRQLLERADLEDSVDANRVATPIVRRIPDKRQNFGSQRPKPTIHRKGAQHREPARSSPEPNEILFASARIATGVQPIKRASQTLRKTHLYVPYVFDPDRWRVVPLQNPVGATTRDRFRVIRTGSVRYGFDKK
jgi:hypothetical protein